VAGKASASGTPALPASAGGKRRRLALALLLLATGGAVAGYLAWRPRAAPVPPISTEGMDSEMAAAIMKARAEVEAQPRSADAWGKLGMVLYAHSLYADAVPFLTEAERLDKADPRWPYLHGLAAIMSRDDEAIAYLERAVRLAPASVTTRLRLAEEYWNLERVDEAEVLFRALLEEDPANGRALLGHGRVLSRRGQWREALGPLALAAADPVARRSARIALAEAYLRLGDPAQAEAERRRAADGGPDIPWPDSIAAEAEQYQVGLEMRLQEALRLAESGQIDAALARVEQALRDHPDSDEAHVALARVLVRANRLDEAEKELRRAVALNPRLVDGHFRLGGVLMLRKQYAGAERSYRQAVALQPTHGLALYNLGECCLKLGRPADAIEAFRDATRAHPELAAAHLRLGELLLEAGKAAEAADHLEQATTLDTGNQQARNLLEQARQRLPRRNP
jgi:tetratricopeptide (TPR) repeat protein